MLGLDGSSDIFVARSIVNAPIAQGSQTFPTLVFMPGFFINVGLYASWLESLASGGWVVVAIEHPGISTTVYPDGTVELPPQGADLDEHLAAVVADALFVRGELTNPDVVPFAPEQLDQERIGYFGQSYGGATSVAVCEFDPTCAGSINVDGRFFLGTPDPVYDVATKPWGLILSDGHFDPGVVVDGGMS